MRFRQPARPQTVAGVANPGSVRGAMVAATAVFLTFAPLSSADLGPPVAERTPPTRAEIDAAIARGVDFLIASQNKDGSWGSARNTKGLNIYAPIPGAHHAFRAAVTALSITALIETGAAETNPKAAAALERAEDWLLENLGSVRRATPKAIYNVWGHSYGITALAAMHGRSEDAERKKEIVAAVESQIEKLQRYESVDGGWGYYDFRYQTKKPSSSSSSFTNATGLVSLHQAKGIGVDVPERLVKRAVDATVRQRKPDFSYAYGEYLKMRPMRSINRPGGSLGRSQACNIALRLWGDDKITDEVMDTWLDRLWARNGWLSIGRKRPVPHESWFGVAGYFYYYGHYYAALCIESLHDEKLAAHHRGQLAAVIVPLQEKDGSWWDYPFYAYHQPYGTAFALLTLQRCR